MTATTARRTSERTLELRGAALDTVMQMAASPYDLHHPHNKAASEAFYPAREYVKLLGHLTRAYLDPNGWVRDAAFEMRINSMTVASDNPEALDSVERLIGHLNPRAGEPTYLFRYLHVDAEGEPVFDPARLVAISGGGVETLIETDGAAGGRGLIILHQSAIDAAFARYLAERLDIQLQVSAVAYTIDLLGFAYDSAAREHLYQRSADELSDATVSARHGLGGILRPPQPLTPFTPLPVEATPIEIAPEGWDLSDRGAARYGLDHEAMLDELEASGEIETEGGPSSASESLDPEYDEFESAVEGVIFSGDDLSPDGPLAPGVGAFGAAPDDDEAFLDSLLANPVPRANTQDDSPPGQVSPDDDDPLSFLD
jgi:hypothetical protein